MDIIISNSVNEPIYSQISSQIKDMIIKGQLKEGEPLPSMRNLAMQLKISVITTKRAYEDLERDGYIESFTGKGSFVKKQNREFIKEEIQKEMEDLLSLACEKAKLCGTSVDEMKEILDIIYGGA